MADDDKDSDSDTASTSTTTPTPTPTLENTPEPATATATATAMISTPPKPTSSCPSPEHGSFANLDHPRRPDCIKNGSSNPRLLCARMQLLRLLPQRRDHVLRSITSAYDGGINQSHSQPPRTYHYAAPDVETFLRNRKSRFSHLRRKAGYSDCGGGLQWRNQANIQLRRMHIRKMWPECLEFVQMEEAELPEEDEDTEISAGISFVRLKMKMKRVGKVLGMTLREKGEDFVKKIGDW